MKNLGDTILVVDDDSRSSRPFPASGGHGLVVCGTAATADAVTLAQMHRPAVVLMDMRLLVDRDGVDAALAAYETVGS